MWIQATFFTGEDCLQFLQVIGGILPAPAGDLRETSFVRATVEFFKTRDLYFYPIPNNLTKVTTYCLWNEWKILRNWFSSEKGGLLIVGCSIRCPKNRPHSLWQNWPGTDCCHFCHIYWAQEKYQTKLRFERRHLRRWSTWRFRCRRDVMLLSL